MATIEKRGKRYRVRWRDPDGNERSRSVPDKKTAREIKTEVERALARRQRWQPSGSCEQADIEVAMSAYVTDCSRINMASTTRRYACCLEIFRTWLAAREGEGRVLHFGLLSKSLLSEFWIHLLSTGRHGKPRKPGSAQKILQAVQQWWKWAYSEDEYLGLLPQPQELKVRSEARTPTLAPTWAEMDACIAECNGWHRQIAVLLRFTGLRVQQAMHLRWEDFDLHNHLLTIRGELGKTAEERKGRIIPISQHLADEMAGWGPRQGFIVLSGRKADGPRAREARGRDMGRAWRRAGVRVEVWKSRPHHAFRKGFVSGLKRARADVDAVEFLVGHSLGLRGVYTDPDVLPLREAVGLVPIRKQNGCGTSDIVVPLSL
jgi:integrase